MISKLSCMGSLLAFAAVLSQNAAGQDAKPKESGGVFAQPIERELWDAREKGVTEHKRMKEVFPEQLFGMLPLAHDKGTHIGFHNAGLFTTLLHTGAVVRVTQPEFIDIDKKKVAKKEAWFKFEPMEDRIVENVRFWDGKGGYYYRDCGKGVFFKLEGWKSYQPIKLEFLQPGSTVILEAEPMPGAPPRHTRIN